MLADGEAFYQDPGDNQLARLARGALVRDGERTSGEWQRVSIEGWIIARSTGPANREGFELAVTRAPDERIRVAPNGALVARVVQGMQLERVSAESGWVFVRREGWVRRAGLAPLTETAAAPAAATGAPSPTPSTPTPAVETPLPAVPDPDPRVTATARDAQLYRAPDGDAAGTLTRETPVRVLGRSGEWSRVQVEAWVKTSDVRAAPPGVLVGLSAAELRADPVRYRGQVLLWTVQYIASQTADDLRPDIPAGATYLLAKGPLPERGFVYVVVPDSQKALVTGLTPLTVLQVTARVRAGRSRFLGHPVVDLLTMEAQP